MKKYKKNTLSKAGIYNWAGPGTIRMVDLKYPRSKIDHHSLSNAYNYQNLKAAQEVCQITDSWVTYSWGFSPETEAEDYRFLRKKLPNFQKLGIRTHAYIQGPNLVYEEHKDQDLFCLDQNQRLIPYHRGRKMTCVNNPRFIEYLEKKVKLALREEIDGIFLDNVFFGLFPITMGNKVSFFGCNCLYCQKLFQKKYGQKIPKIFDLNSELFFAYQDFRVKSLTRFIKYFSALAKDAKKTFGFNNLDPKFEPKLFYGLDYQSYAKSVDYFLFENHDAPTGKGNNLHLKELFSNLKKDIFVVSYKEGIGKEKLYQQHDFDAICSEANFLGYNPCYKASEYTHHGIWQNLDFSKINKVEATNSLWPQVPKNHRDKKVPELGISKLLNHLYVPTLEKYYENRFIRKIGNWAYYKAIH